MAVVTVCAATRAAATIRELRSRLAIFAPSVLLRRGPMHSGNRTAKEGNRGRKLYEIGRVASMNQ